MSGDYETLEINQPKISYFKKRLENNTEWLDQLIKKIDDMKNEISKPAQFLNYFQVMTILGNYELYFYKLKRNKKPPLLIDIIVKHFIQ